jgi:hypothetical protein
MVTALGSFQHSRRWRPKTQKIIMDEKFTWSPTWHTINNVSWCVGICIILTKVKGPHHHMVTTLARVWSGPRTCFAMANVTISRSTPFWQVHLHFMQRATPPPPFFQCDGRHPKLPYKWWVEKIYIFHTKLEIKSFYFKNICREPQTSYNM